MWCAGPWGVVAIPLLISQALPPRTLQMWRWKLVGGKSCFRVLVSGFGIQRGRNQERPAASRAMPTSNILVLVSRLQIPEYHGARIRRLRNLGLFFTSKPQVLVVYIWSDLRSGTATSKRRSLWQSFMSARSKPEAHSRVLPWPCQ